jgi:hypothetical protein
MTFRLSYLLIFVAAIAPAAFGQQTPQQYPAQLKSATASCDAQRDLCINTCTDTPSCNECDVAWRACKSGLNPDIDAMVTPRTPSSSPLENPDQNNLKHYVDGCSIPWWAVPFTPGLSAQDPVGGVLGKVPTTLGQNLGSIASASAAGPLPCNQHDICYQTCHEHDGKGKDSCDESLYEQAVGVCDAAYGSSLGKCPFGGWWNYFVCYGMHMQQVDMRGWYEERDNCYMVTEKIKDALTGSPKAMAAYCDDQSKYCKDGGIGKGCP